MLVRMPSARLRLEQRRVGIERQAAIERDRFGDVRGAAQLAEAVGEGLAGAARVQQDQDARRLIDAPAARVPARPAPRRRPRARPRSAPDRPCRAFAAPDRARCTDRGRRPRPRASRAARRASRWRSAATAGATTASAGREGVGNVPLTGSDLTVRAGQKRCGRWPPTASAHVSAVQLLRVTAQITPDLGTV